MLADHLICYAAMHCQTKDKAQSLITQCIELYVQDYEVYLLPSLRVCQLGA